MEKITVWCNCPEHGESGGTLMEREEEHVEYGDPPGLEGGQIIFKCPHCEHRTFVRVESQEDLKEIFDALEKALAEMEEEPETPYWLEPEEVTILDKAIDTGYYETPKRITFDELAEELSFFNPEILKDKLHIIDGKVTQRFIKQMRTPLVAPEPPSEPNVYPVEEVLEDDGSVSLLYADGKKTPLMPEPPEESEKERE